jgi:hypothetical protein
MQKINKLTVTQVSSIIKVPIFYSISMEEELIQVANMATKHENKNFLTWLGGFFPYLSLGVER